MMSLDCEFTTKFRGKFLELTRLPLVLCHGLLYPSQWNCLYDLGNQINHRRFFVGLVQVGRL